MARPIVSVLIDTYNYEREILVVDDCSQDRTSEIAAKFARRSA